MIDCNGIIISHLFEGFLSPLATTKEYEDMAIKVGDKVGMEINKAK
jgi:hypothetical protein